MATARPTVSVYGADATPAKQGLCLPAVFSAPLRADLVRYVHRNMAKNKRQSQAVKSKFVGGNGGRGNNGNSEAGYDTAAISWGTGRAVARIPRVPGGGTHRSGQAAFGNMCRGGGMFAPLRTWRRWHRKTNVTQKRHALAASVAASAVPALVMARGHKVDEVVELPLVLSDSLNTCTKTKDAFAALTALGCGSDLDKCASTKSVRAGRGKCRNRRYVVRKGPLVVHALTKEEMMSAGLSKSFRNIPGVEVAHVDRLNLLQLAPGGAFGRFVIYTESAVKRLSALFGSFKTGSSLKKGYTLPTAMMANADVARIINSDEVQSAVEMAKEAPQTKTCRMRKNPLKNQSVLGRMCPYALKAKKVRKVLQAARIKSKAEGVKRASTKSGAAGTKKTALRKSSVAYHKALQGEHPSEAFVFKKET